MIRNSRGRLLAAAGLLLTLSAAAPAQEQPVVDDAPAEVSERVAVTPQASDAAIDARLERVLAATGWFRAEVRVAEGIVFLEGVADSDEHRDWAVQLARNTDDVLAVVNRLSVPERSIWDLSPTWRKLYELTGDAVRAVPLALVALAMILVTWLLARWSVRGVAAVLRRRIHSELLTQVVARAAAVPVFLLGAYVVLKISGLSGLALSLLGGTGLVGLIIGFAFRDIAENFLASLLISVQRPFATGDLIRVAGHLGFVQRVNTRATLLMTQEGNHVQIPNATIYKETIVNFTANPNERFDFRVGIGYSDAMAQAQSVALDVLRGHPAVLAEPEPLVLVEELGAATVNLRVYFWVDISRHDGPKVKSSVIRQVKRAFDEARISMPDEAREIVFPEGIPLDRPGDAGEPRHAPPEAATEDADDVHSAEGGLTSTSEEIDEQARRARLPESGKDLLNPSPEDHSSSAR